MNRTSIYVQILAGVLAIPLLAGCSPSDPATRPPDPIFTPAAETTPLPTGVEPSAAAESILATEVTTITPTATPTTTGRFVQFEDQLAEVEFRLPLTIQHISHNQAWLFFELERPAAGELFYWVDGRADLGVYGVEFGPDSNRHLIELSDLLPDTRYRARVGLPGASGSVRSPGLNGEQWGETSLTTYPEQLEHLRAAVIGDSGFGEQITYALSAQMAALDLDFVIHTGDIVYSAFENGTPLRAYQAKYFWPFQKILLRAPVYAVPGNHEYYSDASIDGIPYYFNIYPPIGELVRDGSWVGSDEIFRNWYAVRLMDYQLLFLESQRFYRPEGVGGETEWLQQRLSEFQDPTIGIFHITSYTSGSHAQDGLPIQQAWLPLFREANTALIVSGHDHNYERIEVNGLDLIVSGGGSGKIYRLKEPVEGSRVFAAESHFVLLDIYPDRIELSAINAYGDILDQTTLDVDR
ncbi:MAG: metallophosphoesterase [Anaerolineales bacterium]|nr:metallophosphoesterase [Anaerolineales bacterium]